MKFILKRASLFKNIMAKILYIHNTDISSKTANLTQVISMCNAFCEENHEVTLLLPTNKSIALKNIEQLKIQFPIHEKLNLVTFNNPFKKYKWNKNLNFLTLLKFLLKNKFDKDNIVFVRSVHYLFVSIWLGFKTIYESHNFLVHQGNSLTNKFLSKLLIYLFKKKKAILFIGISQNLTDFWINKGIDKKKALSSHDGFSPSMYPKQYDKNEIKRRLGINADRFSIVYTGNIHENRGIDYIIETAKQIQNADFYIVGGPNAMIDFYQKTYNFKAFKNIKFIGQVVHQDAINYQLAADLLLAVWSKHVPTINYCSPLKLFEYMATGNPTLAFGYPTILEVLVDRKNAYICIPDDVNDMVEKINFILTDDKKDNIAQLAMKEAYEHYTWNSRVYQIISRIHV